MIRTGIGYDSHRFADDSKLILGGVEIPHTQGLQGHSDADVLTHAVIDALLGAAADGDIGKHFPDTDEQWKDANSLELLRTVVGRLNGRGMSLCNVDSTIVGEQPRLAPHIDEMRRGLAVALGLAIERVSVKATTAEKMGALGRGEGIAVQAIATIEEKEEAK